MSSLPIRSGGPTGRIEGYDIVVSFDDEKQPHIFGCEANLDDCE